MIQQNTLFPRKSKRQRTSFPTSIDLTATIQIVEIVDQQPDNMSASGF